MTREKLFLQPKKLMRTGGLATVGSAAVAKRLARRRSARPDAYCISRLTTQQNCCGESRRCGRSLKVAHLARCWNAMA
jgi:hypothetical protein